MGIGGQEHRREDKMLLFSSRWLRSRVVIGVVFVFALAAFLFHSPSSSSTPSTSTSPGTTTTSNPKGSVVQSTTEVSWLAGLLANVTELTNAHRLSPIKHFIYSSQRPVQMITFASCCSRQPSIAILSPSSSTGVQRRTRTPTYSIWPKSGPSWTI